MALRASQRAHRGVRGSKAGKEPRKLSEAFAVALRDHKRERTQRKRTAGTVENMVAEAEKRNTPSMRLMVMLAEAGAGDFKPEHEFARLIGRGWAFDIAFLKERVAVEIEGGIFKRTGDEQPCPLCRQVKKGAHASVSGILRDIEKYNAAMILGWRVFRVPTHKINHQTVRMILKVLGRKTRARRVMGVKRATRP